MQAEVQAASTAFVAEFAAVLALLDPVAASLEPLQPDAKKKLGRARMLHAVMAEKAPTLDGLKTMTGEWIHGMLEATFKFESSLVDSGAASRFLSQPAAHRIADTENSIHDPWLFPSPTPELRTCYHPILR